MSHTRYVFKDQHEEPVHRPLGQLLYLSESEYESDWASYTHSHPFAELFYVRSGRGYFVMDHQEFPVSQGDLLLINAHLPHTEKSEGSKPMRYLVMGIAAIAFESKAATTMKDSQYSFLKLREQAAILPLVDAMEQEAATEKTHYVEYCQALYEQLIINIIRDNEIKLTLTKNEEISNVCAALKSYMEKHYHLDISLDSMAARFHINKYHLAHRFTGEYGVPPIQYLNNLRIKEAKNLLKNSDFSISQISQMLGFSSLSYFGQSFKRATGLSAGQYRKMRKVEAAKAKLEINGSTGIPFSEERTVYPDAKSDRVEASDSEP